MDSILKNECSNLKYDNEYGLFEKKRKNWKIQKDVRERKIVNRKFSSNKVFSSNKYEEKCSQINIQDRNSFDSTSDFVLFFPVRENHLYWISFFWLHIFRINHLRDWSSITSIDSGSKISWRIKSVKEKGLLDFCFIFYSIFCIEVYWNTSTDILI